MREDGVGDVAARHILCSVHFLELVFCPEALDFSRTIIRDIMYVSRNRFSALKHRISRGPSSVTSD